MKYSQFIGVVACVALIFFCYQPWSFIASKNIIVSGMKATGTNFGKPGLLHIILNSVMIVLFVLPRVWAKRANVLIAALNLAWAIRNYLLITSCSAGDCPQKKAGLYLLLASAIIIQIMTFLPRITFNEKE